MWEAGRGPDSVRTRPVPRLPLLARRRVSYACLLAAFGDKAQGPEGRSSQSAQSPARKL